MVRTGRLLGALAAAWVMLSSAAFGDSIRCGTRTVVTGDTREELIMKCGPPDSSEVVGVERRGSVARGGYAETVRKVEKLTYNCGDMRLMRVVTVMDGKVIKIETSGYGSGPSKCD